MGRKSKLRSLFVVSMVFLRSLDNDIFHNNQVLIVNADKVQSPRLCCGQEGLGQFVSAS